MSELINLSNLENSITRERYGGKAANLAELARIDGVNVPEGFAVSIEEHTQYKETQTVDDELVVSILNSLVELGDKIAIRSSATNEDGDQSSMAGVFTTEILDLSECETEEHKKAAIGNAVKDIYDQACSDEVGTHAENPNEVQMGLVVQRYIEPSIAGVAYTGLNGGSILLQYHNGRGDEIVDGNVNGVRLKFDPEVGIITDSINYDQTPLNDALLSQLISTTKTIEQHFSNVAQDIEFAVDQDSGELYIVQSRTQTTELPDRNFEVTETEVLELTRLRMRALLEEDARKYGLDMSIFINSNFAELIPNPSEMEFAIFTYIFTGLDGQEGAIQLGREELGYIEQFRSAGYLQMVGNRPYFSLVGDAATYFMGIPDEFDEYREKFIKKYIDTVREDPSRANYPEMGLYIQNPSRDELVDIFGEDQAKIYYQRLIEFQEHLRGQAEIQADIMNGFAILQIDRHINELEEIDVAGLETEDLVGHVHGVLEHMRNVSCVEFVKAARLGFYYSQRFRELMQGLGYDSDETDKYYAALSEDPDGNLITEIDLRIIDAETEDEAMNIARETIGFYSSGEDLEIRHPRFSDNERDLSNYVEGLRENGEDYKSRLEQSRNRTRTTMTELLSAIDDETQREELRSVINYMQKYMSLRQTIKFHFKREYGVIRQALVAIEEKLNLQKGDIFYVYPRELSRLVDNSDRLRHLIRDRRRHHEMSSRIEIPDVVSMDTLDEIDIIDEDGVFTEATGEVLNSLDDFPIGDYIAVVINEDFDLSDEMEWIRGLQDQGYQVVLIASQIGLSLDNLIAQADAVIIQHGGLTCHAAQRCRELSTPLITGILIRNIQEGQNLVIDYENGHVRSVTPVEYKSSDEESVPVPYIFERELDLI
jgi:pyruvate,water dikinase